MPLRQTNDLIATYGSKLVDGSISNEELASLHKSFGKLPENGYTDPGTVTQTNYSVNDGIRDFVQTLCENLNESDLHALTMRIFENTVVDDPKTFMRNSTLEKVLLAYEMVKYPALSEEHFKSGKIPAVFSNPSDITNVRQTILGPICRYFNNPTFVPNSEDSAFSKRNLSVENSTESKYHFAYNSIMIITIKRKYDRKINDAIDLLLTEVHKLKVGNKVPFIELAEILTDTHDLLNGNLTPEGYEEKAQKVQGKSYAGLKVLGGIMMALSALVAAAGVMLIATGIGAVPGAAALAGGTAGIAAGMSLFSLGKQSGLSKIMTDVNEALANQAKAQ